MRMHSFQKLTCCLENCCTCCDPSLSFVYTGSLNVRGQPHGYGTWRDSDPNGELLAGWFKDGLPHGLHRSREYRNGGTFSSVHIGVATCTNAAVDMIQAHSAWLPRPVYALAAAEVCVSGTFYRGFPAVSYLQGSPPEDGIYMRDVMAALRMGGSGSGTSADGRHTAAQCQTLARPWDVPSPMEIDLQVPSTAAAPVNGQYDGGTGTGLGIGTVASTVHGALPPREALPPHDWRRYRGAVSRSQGQVQGQGQDQSQGSNTSRGSRGSKSGKSKSPRKQPPPGGKGHRAWPGFIHVDTDGPASDSDMVPMPATLTPTLSLIRPLPRPCPRLCP
jgi:hypothetical protein